MPLTPSHSILRETEEIKTTINTRIIANKSVIRGGVKEENNRKKEEEVLGFKQNVAPLPREPGRVSEVCF